MDNNLEIYDEDIELLIEENGLLNEDEKEKLYNEWSNIKNQVNNINEKYQDNDFFKENTLKSLRKKYLQQILVYEEDSPQYNFYKIILECLGIDSYVLESEIKQIRSIKKK